MGRVTELWRYPVKSMTGERISEADVTERGIEGDRAHAVIDADTGKIASAKRPKLWGDLLHFSAALRGDVVEICFPDGHRATTADETIDADLSAALGREVRMAATAERGARLDEIWLEDKGSSMYGPVVADEDGMEVIDLPASTAAPPGTFFDFAAIHLITTASLRALQAEHPDGRFDAARFRPNLVLDVDGPAFMENDWHASTLRIGDVRFQGIMPAMRCVMTTLAQAGLPKDSGILRAVARTNMVDFPSRVPEIAELAGFGAYPTLGLYASVVGGGALGEGDPVSVS